MDYRKLASRGKLIAKNNGKSGVYTLQGKQYAAFQDAQAGQEIEVISGTIWLTQYGDIRDYNIKSGSGFTVTRSGLLFIGSMGDEQVSFRMK